MISDKDRILDRMRRLCSRREYCTADIRSKVKALVPEGEDCTEEIIRTLEADRYLDDMRYACAFARDKSSLTGWGSLKIRYALNAKGIPRDIIDAALEGVNPESSGERLDRLLSVKYASLKDDPQVKLKLLRFALGRGYGYDEAGPAVERVIQGKGK